MDPIELLAVAVVVPLVVAAGVVVHELSHAITLRALGVSCRVQWFPGQDVQGLESTNGAWATVVPQAVPSDLPPWRLRVAALMPLTLAFPIPLVLAGVLPDPVAMGNPVLAAATAGWLACAIPSPQDFSLVWHAETAIDRYAT